MLVCWSVGGGVGTTVVVAGLACAATRSGRSALVVDLGGDQPALFDVPEPAGPGLAEWLRASPDVPYEALGHLELSLGGGIDLIPRGAGPLRGSRMPALVEGLVADDRHVVVDAGTTLPGSAMDELGAAADRSLLVVRACPLTLRRVEHLATAPSGIVVVRDRRRPVTWQEVASAVGAPVVAELEVDPAVATAVDAGLQRRPLPRRYLRALERLW